MDLMTELSTEIFNLYWSLSINEMTFSFQNSYYSISDFKRRYFAWVPFLKK